MARYGVAEIAVWRTVAAMAAVVALIVLAQRLFDWRTLDGLLPLLVLFNGFHVFHALWWITRDRERSVVLKLALWGVWLAHTVGLTLFFTPDALVAWRKLLTQAG
jgi:hypothetical protein